MTKGLPPARVSAIMRATTTEEGYFGEMVAVGASELTLSTPPRMYHLMAIDCSFMKVNGGHLCQYEPMASKHGWIRAVPEPGPCMGRAICRILEHFPRRTGASEETLLGVE